MTTAEAEAFAAFQKQQEKERIARQRKANREVYAELVDDEIATALPELRALSDQIKAVKAKVFENFKEVLRMKSEVMQLTTDTQRTHLYPQRRQYAPDAGRECRRRLARYGGGRHHNGKAVHRKPCH